MPAGLIIRTGRLSFHAASRVLPARVREPATALYAFCRVADDAIDRERHDNAGACTTCRERLDLTSTPADPQAAGVRPCPGLMWCTISYQLPRVLPDALLEGLAWDSPEGRRYDRLIEQLHDYGARVAGTVGAMMCRGDGSARPSRPWHARVNWVWRCS
jgi:phytoene synthase